MKLLQPTLFMMLTVQYFTASVRLHFTNHSLNDNERCVRALVHAIQLVECVTNVRVIFKQKKNLYCSALSWGSLLSKCASGTDDPSPWFHSFTRVNGGNMIGLCWCFLKMWIKFQWNHGLLSLHRTYFEDNVTSHKAHERGLCCD